MAELFRMVVVGPLKDIGSNPAFFGEGVIGGILAGTLYSLVAPGLRPVYKAPGGFNFAQGVMVLFAALTLVGLMERGVPVPLALALAALVMVALAYAIERVVL